MTSASAVQLELDTTSHVAHVWLNRPDGANGLNLELAREMLAVADQIRASEARSVLLRGRGKFFCGGGDVKAFSSQGPEAVIPELLSAWHPAVNKLIALDVPLIAAVHGSAAGAGLGLALACDLVIAARSTRFVMAYTAIGLSPDGSSSWFLPRVVGHHRAMELALLNRVLGAEEAQSWGIVNSVVDDDALNTRAEELAVQIAAGPTAAFRAARRLMHQSWSNSLDQHLIQEAAYMTASAATHDAQEGVAAFVERRPPVFTGR